MRHFVGEVIRVLGETSRGRSGVSGEAVRDLVPEREAGELRVMTFNVRGSFHPDGNNAWGKRAPLNVDVIRRWKPDLIGFQEFQRGNRATYEKELPGYESRLGPKYQNGKPHAFNAIFWDAERLELVDSGGFWLSRTPEKFSRSWTTSQIRSANWLRFRLIPENKEFIHLNTHLDHRSPPARQNGTRLIVHELEDMRDTPTIVTGDFNAEPGKLAYRTFIEADFEDTHLLAGNRRAKTFHRFQGEKFIRGNERELRMDWILVRGGTWKTSSHHVVHDCEPPVFPSDHYPVVARLSLG